VTIHNVEKLVREEVARSPNALASAIAFVVSKNWLAMAMLVPIGKIATPFDLTFMENFMGRFKCMMQTESKHFGDGSDA
jgi:hypothetical protein